MESKALRNGAIVAFVASMALLLVGGYFAKDRVAPIPEKVLAEAGSQTQSTGTPLFGREEIMAGQDVFQRYGLMDHGSIWGNGTYRGMDFSADTLHRIGVHMRDFYAAGGTIDDSNAAAPGDRFLKLPHDRQREISARVIEEIKSNRYDPAAKTLTLTPGQAYALGEIRKYWDKEFGQGDKGVGFLPNTIASAEDRRHLADFFFWTAWVAGANRPGLDHTYTNNWPADRSVGNEASGQAFLYSIVSIFSFFAVLGLIVYVTHRYRFFFGPARGVHAAYELMEMPVTPSQRATGKFFLVAGLLFLVQILNGGLLANYTVRPGQFYIQWIGQVYNYSWAKTWHVQLAILWIAVAWIGTAVYLAPLIAQREPKRQKLLVNLLFLAAVAVVGCSMLGEVLSIKGNLGDAWNWFGHQGWEYLELGKFYQILLFGGLIFWLVIVYRSLGGVIRGGEKDPYRRSLVVFYLLSAILVVAFFGFGLLYGKGTHLTIADYWRWFVVHIWVESIFEFFGVAVIALFLVTMGLVTAQSALRVAYLTAILVFVSGIPGVAHHYFWFGGPSFWLAIGGAFSSLEPVPLILLVVRAWMEYRSIRREGGEFPYRWPLYFLVASSVWNFIGAATFGFIINLPIVNYYEHGTYLTTNHAHTALFGVYGMLAVALILFAWRGLVENKFWSDRLLKISFWGLNGGLFLMFTITLLPMGLLQVWHSYTDGLWYARSNDFYEMPLVKTLALWRALPDTIIIVVGALPLLYFLLTTYLRLRKVGEVAVIPRHEAPRQEPDEWDRQ